MNESKPNYGFQNSYDDYYKKDFKKYETKKEDNKFEKKDTDFVIRENTKYN